MSEELNEIADPLYALSSISETINTLYEIDELLARILAIALKTVNAERGFILMSSEDDPSQLSVRVAHNIDSKAIPRWQRFRAAWLMPPSLPGRH